MKKKKGITDKAAKTNLGELRKSLRFTTQTIRVSVIVFTELLLMAKNG